MELDGNSAPAWLSAHGINTSRPGCAELGGGVSNRVVLVESPEIRTVLKQSLGRLRVEREWLSDRARIFREADAMRWLAGRVRGGRVPALLAEDREEFVIAMEAAPQGAEMWKTHLLSGIADPSHAHAAGILLGSIIAASWNHPEARELFGDQTVFHQLRLEPYYLFTASRHASHRGYFESLISKSGARRVSLVHGDWSPKNLLISGCELWAIDWEVVHFGDPAFDVGFLLNHLVLKSVARPQSRDAFAVCAAAFLQALRCRLPPEANWVESAAIEHLPALLLARADGKSPAEYLDEAGRDRVRRLALSLMDHPVASITEVFQR